MSLPWLAVLVPVITGTVLVIAGLIRFMILWARPGRPDGED